MKQLNRIQSTSIRLFTPVCFQLRHVDVFIVATEHCGWHLFNATECRIFNKIKVLIL